MTTRIDLNNRPNLILKSFADLNAQRVVLIALPFLALNPTTALVSSLGISFYQGITLWTTTADKTTTGNKWTEAALLISSTALSYFCPLAQLVLSNGVSFASSSYRLWTAESWQNRGQILLQVSHQSIHLASLYYGTAGWMCASLLSQTGSELIQAGIALKETIQAWRAPQDTKKDQTLEMIAFALLAYIRLKKAYSYLPDDFSWTRAQKKTLSPPTVQELTKDEKSNPVLVEEKSIQLEEESSPRTAIQEAQHAVEEKDPLLGLKRNPCVATLKEENPIATTVSEPVPAQPLRKATAEDFTNLFRKHGKNFDVGLSRSFTINKSSLLDFRAALLQEGFLPEIEGLEFHSGIYNCAFEGLSFKNCNFKNARFNNCKFGDVLFIESSFKKTTWSAVALQNSIFNGCDFSKAMIAGRVSGIHDCYPTQFINLVFTNCDFSKSIIRECIILDSVFKECDFINANIFQAKIKNTALVQVNLTQSNWIQSNFHHLKIQEGKLSEASFLQSSVSESQLIECDLKDALLLDAKEGFSIQGGIPHQITKPIIAIGWDFGGRGDYEKLTTRVLRENNMLVLPYSNSEGHHAADKSLLFSEMEAQFYKVLFHKTIVQGQSISQQLLENTIKSAQIDQLKKDAAEILKYADGLIVPGGGDIVPCLYKSGQLPKFDFRSLLEIAMIAEAHQRKIPTMGICRGAQMINVFFGGTLIDVKYQDGYHSLEWTNAPAGQHLQQKLGNNFKAESNHHQAVDQVGQGLQVVLKREDIPKMLLSEDGTFIASQVHPESYLDLKEELEKSKLMDDKLIEQMQNSSTSEIMGIYNTIIEEMQKKLQDQYPQHTFLHRQVELLKECLFEQTDSVVAAMNSMFANRNIYRFFFEKVQSFIASSRPSQSLVATDPVAVSG